MLSPILKYLMMNCYSKKYHATISFYLNKTNLHLIKSKAKKLKMKQF